MFSAYALQRSGIEAGGAGVHHQPVGQTIEGIAFLRYAISNQLQISVGKGSTQNRPARLVFRCDAEKCYRLPSRTNRGVFTRNAGAPETIPSK